MDARAHFRRRGARKAKPLARLARPMTLVRGIWSGARGACPVCGNDVQRTHAFNGARLTDAYACGRCGPTEYRVSVAPLS